MTLDPTLVHHTSLFRKEPATALHLWREAHKARLEEASNRSTVTGASAG
jgi:hypothetical protein